MSTAVLIVEDDSDSRETLRELLELEGYAVKTAANGQEALRELEEYTPCVMLLDLAMPVMDGQAVIEQLRNDGRLDSLHVIIITSSPYKAPAGLKVLAKPIDLTKLSQAIAAVC
jgi:CheY-like chemotaxis protein